MLVEPSPKNAADDVAVVGVLVGESGADGDRCAGADDAVRAEHADVEVRDVHRAAAALAVAGRLAHQLGHHLVELAALGDEVAVAAVGRGDLVVIAQRGAHTGRDRLLADVEVEEAGKLGGLGEPARRFFEESDPHHAAVQVHLHVGREFHRCPVCRVGRMRSRVAAERSLSG